MDCSTLTSKTGMSRFARGRRRRGEITGSQKSRIMLGAEFRHRFLSESDGAEENGGKSDMH